MKNKTYFLFGRTDYSKEGYLPEQFQLLKVWYLGDDTLELHQSEEIISDNNNIVVQFIDPNGNQVGKFNFLSTNPKGFTRVEFCKCIYAKYEEIFLKEIKGTVEELDKELDIQYGISAHPIGQLILHSIVVDDDGVFILHTK